MKPRLTPHPQSEKHNTIPTKVFLDPTAFTVGEVEAQRQQALRLLRRYVSLAKESCTAAVPLCARQSFGVELVANILQSFQTHFTTHKAL